MTKEELALEVIDRLKKCGGIGGCPSGRHRGDCEAVRSGTQQGAGHQRLYEDAARRVRRACAG